MTMNDTWGYKVNDHHFKSTKVLIQNLVDIASKGGNYLLNIGPSAEGLVPDESIVRLQQVGKWMDINGEAVHGTTNGPFNYLSWGRSTRKGQTLYLSVFNWPVNHTLHVPLKNSVTKVYLLDGKKTLSYKPGTDGLDISLPANAPDSIASVIAIQFAGEPSVPPIASAGKMASSSSQLTGNEAAKAFDGRTQSTWRAEKADTTAWLQIDLGKLMKISAVALQEGSGKEQTIAGYSLQYEQKGEWKTVFEGKKIGRGLLKPFSPINAQVFRLVITQAKPGIQIQEMMLFTD